MLSQLTSSRSSGAHWNLLFFVTLSSTERNILLIMEPFLNRNINFRWLTQFSGMVYYTLFSMLFLLYARSPLGLYLNHLVARVWNIACFCIYMNNMCRQEVLLWLIHFRVYSSSEVKSGVCFAEQGAWTQALRQLGVLLSKLALEFVS